MMSHQRALRDAHVLVAKGLAPARHRRLREHLRGCDACLRQYEQLRAVENALSPGEVMAPSAFERMSELVLDEVSPKPRRAGIAWSFGLSAATAMAVVMWLVVPAGGEFGSRGGAAPETRYGLSLFVIDPTTQQASRATVDGARVTVPAGQLIQLAYRNDDARYLAVVAVDAEGEVQVYYPGDDERDAGGVRLVAGAHDEPLPGAWSLDDVAMPLRVFAFFSREPLDRREVREIAWHGLKPPTLLIDVAKR